MQVSSSKKYVKCFNFAVMYPYLSAISSREAVLRGLPFLAAAREQPSRFAWISRSCIFVTNEATEASLDPWWCYRRCRISEDHALQHVLCTLNRSTCMQESPTCPLRLINSLISFVTEFTHYKSLISFVTEVQLPSVPRFSQWLKTCGCPKKPLSILL